MVIDTDFILKIYTRKNGKQNIHRWYRQYCDGCGKDRGYLPKSHDKKCISCACKGRIISDEQRRSISNTLSGRTGRVVSQETKDRSGATKMNLSIEDYIKNKPAQKAMRKLKKNISDRLIRFIKNTRKTYKFMDFDAASLRKHLETQFHNHPVFDDLMTWENYGRIKGKRCWELDHIIPLHFKNPDGSFYWDQKELADPTSDTFKKAWSFDNLQPMWADFNWRKKNTHKGTYQEFYKISKQDYKFSK